MTFQRRRSPRERRLNSDLRALQQLVQESSIVEYEASGNPPEQYRIRFHGNGLWRTGDSGDVLERNIHEVTITLTSAYPRMIPELAWQTPIFHPNISASGVVCLGGYGTHWVPSLKIDELCHMLWDMIRYKNFDIESPYNREAAVWAKNQTEYRFPVDDRPLRNQIQSVEKIESPIPLGTIVPGTTNPDAIAPGTIVPDTTNPDAIAPGTITPGSGNPGPLSDAATNGITGTETTNGNVAGHSSTTQGYGYQPEVQFIDSESVTNPPEDLTSENDIMFID